MNPFHFSSCSTPSLQELTVEEQKSSVTVKPSVLASLSACLHRLEIFTVYPARDGPGVHDQHPRAHHYSHHHYYLSSVPSTIPPIFFPSITSLTLRNISATSILQAVLDGCPSLQSASFSVSSPSIDVTHESLKDLDIRCEQAGYATLTLNTPRLQSLRASHFGTIKGTVGGGIDTLSILHSCQSLSLSPVPSQLKSFAILAAFVQPLLQDAVEIIRASRKALLLVQLMPTCRPSLARTDDQGSRLVSGASPLLHPSMLKQLWSAIHGCSSLTALTLDALMVLLPSVDCMLMPSLSKLSLIVWDCKEFLSNEALRTHDSFENLTWRRLTKQLVAGCPRLRSLELRMSENVPPHCLSTLYRGQARLKGVTVLYHTHRSS